MEQRQEHSVQELRIVVCGSSKFNDQSLAFNLFDSIQRMLEQQSRGMMRVGTVISGDFDGIDRLARMWAEQRGVRHENMPWPQSKSVSHSFFDRDMPAAVMMGHPAFSECAECLKKARVNAMAVFPGADGSLGSTARNLKTVAEHLEIGTFSTDEILSKIQKNVNQRAADAKSQQDAHVDASASRAKSRARM